MVAYPLRHEEQEIRYAFTAEDGMQTVEAEVPMAEMSSYTIDLRSMTQGRGSFTCKFIRYEEAPGNVQQKVIEEAKALAEAE